MPANASWIHRAEVMTTVISTGKKVTAITVGRIEAVFVEVAAEAVVAMVFVRFSWKSRWWLWAVEETVATTIFAEVVAEEAVVMMVSSNSQPAILL
jgi:hypothetical protein